MANSLIFRNVSKVPTLQDTARYNKYNIAYTDTYTPYRYQPDGSYPSQSTFGDSSLSKISTVYLYTTIDTTSRPGWYSLTGLISKPLKDLFDSNVASTFKGYYCGNMVGWGGLGETGPWEWEANGCRCMEVVFYGQGYGCFSYSYGMRISKSSVAGVGSFIETIIAPTTYPTNGQYNGYWYIKQ